MDINIRRLSSYLAGSLPPYYMEPLGKLKFASILSNASEKIISIDKFKEFVGFSNKDEEYFFNCLDFVLDFGVSGKDYIESFIDLLEKDYYKSKIPDDAKYSLKEIKISQENESDIKNELEKIIKPLLLTEGKTDSKIIQNAWKKLNLDDCPFDVMSTGLEELEDEKRGSANMLNQQLKFIPNILHDNKIVIGLFDNDKEGYNQWNSLLKSPYFEEYSDNILKHKYKKVYALILPIPDNRKDFVILDDSNYRYLEIEHYFSDDILSLHNKKGKTVAPDSKVFEISDKNKSKFADETKNFTKKDFENFEVLFMEIKSILDI